MFVELFAGQGSLSHAVAKVGVPTMAPNDLASGGTDFSNMEQVDELKDQLKEWKAAGMEFIIHLAPPCSTFSRARDRSRKTRLRSSEFPAGLEPVSEKVVVANRIAVAAYAFAEWAAGCELEAAVTMENPARSYLWDFVQGEAKTNNFQDIVFSQCRFGAPYKKETKLRCWNCRMDKLEKSCSLVGSTFTCGRSKEEGHVVLEFGSASTRDAAAYPEGLCREWAKQVVSLRCEKADPTKALHDVQLHPGGRIKRHRLRGPDEASPKEVKEQDRGIRV